LALLRHLLRLAHEEWELLPTLPKIRLEKESQGRLRWLKPEEATNLLSKCRESRNPDLADLGRVRALQRESARARHSGSPRIGLIGLAA
jgi:hypothetical protein